MKQNARKDVKTIKASKELQQRVGTGEISESVISRAQSVIDTNEVDFAPIARPFLAILKDELGAEAFRKGDYKSADKSALIKPIMNLKANAGSFKYQLVSDMSASVLLLLEKHETLNKKTVQIVDLLHKTVLIVIAKNMKGDGGREGRSLASAFEELCRKFMP